MKFREHVVELLFFSAFLVAGIATAFYFQNFWWLLVGAPAYIFLLVSADIWVEKKFERQYANVKDLASGFGTIAGAILLLGILVFGLISAITSDGECNSGAARFGACD